MASRQSRDDIAVQVRQVEQSLRKVYLDADLLDASDLEGKVAEEREPRLLSRALAAQAVRSVTGASPEEAASVVIDGANDQGIDAISIVNRPDPHIYLVQAKWSKKGNASSDRSAVKELLDGLRLIDNEEFSAFNPRGQQLAEAAKNAMEAGPVSVTQVIALMRADDVTEGFLDAIFRGEKEFNRYGKVLQHKIILAADIWESVRRDLMPAPVVLEAELFPWFAISSPYESFQGVIDATQVAAWMEHGSNLFDLNIRNPLGRTQINSELIETLRDEPANFWYFNNGVTILCESVQRNSRSIVAPQGKPIALTLHNASVVNGAQTVRSVAEAVAGHGEAGFAEVGVRIIVTGADPDFAKRTTQATNRQNRVEARDFVALDRVQAAIIEEMRAELGLEYSVRRSELEPHPDTGCSIVEAAHALACAHPDARYAARIAIASDALWERGSQGMYDTLFRPQPGVYLLWNAVQVLRAVRHSLHDLRNRYEGRGAALTEHGVYLLTHLVFRCLDTDSINEPDPGLEWSSVVVEQTSELVRELIPALISVIDELYSNRSQIRSVCSDSTRCREIVKYVLAARESGKLVQDKYRRASSQRKRRRPNAVSVLVDQNLLPEGEPLTLTTPTSTEAEALRDWIKEDPQRQRATWVPQRSKPILWSADGQRYSPSGLISRIWELAEWEQRPVAVQGTARWSTSSGETLADLAWRALGQLDEDETSDQTAS